MSEENRPGPHPGTRYAVFMDLKICPVCGDRATVVFGARRYCAPCEGECRRYLASDSAAAVGS